MLCMLAATCSVLCLFFLMVASRCAVEQLVHKCFEAIPSPMRKYARSTVKFTLHWRQNPYTGAFALGVRYLVIARCGRSPTRFRIPYAGVGLRCACGERPSNLRLHRPCGGAMGNPYAQLASEVSHQHGPTPLLRRDRRIFHPVQ